MTVQGSHHLNCSTITLQQNLFFGNRTARCNSQYLVLMRNVCEKLQIQTLGRQIYPNAPNFLLECYLDATSKPFSYLVLNLHPQCEDEKLRVLTGIFADEEMYIYIPKVKKPKWK